MKAFLCVIGTIIVLALWPIEGKSKKQSKGVGGRYALLVGCTRYKNLSETWQLRGPANDVVLMRKLLTSRFGFKHSDIVTLAENTKGNALRPTRINIEREFGTLTNKAQSGDQVVIFLAGHGSQQPNKNGNDSDFEPDGFDEVFLPSDSGPWDGRKESIKNAIVDDELRLWLMSIREKGASLWVVVDACHSGTIIRGGEDEVLRQVPRDELIPKEALKKVETRRGKASTDPEAPFEVGKTPNIVAIYAAQASEPTVEKNLPQGSPDRKPYGLLTYTMNQVLTQAETSLTYTELVQQVHAQYVAWGRVYPTPLVEGVDRDKEVLGIRKWPGRSRIMLAQGADGWTVNAGSLHGLTIGTIMAVYPAAGEKNANSIVGHVRVTQEKFGTLKASVVPCKYGNMTVPKAEDLPKNGRCKTVFTDYGIKRPRLTIDSTTDSGEEVSTAEKNRLNGELDKLRKSSDSLICIVSVQTQPDWLLRFDSLKSGKLYLVPASGYAGSSTPGSRPPLFGPVPRGKQLALWLEDRLGQITRAQYLCDVAHRFSNQRIRGTGSVNVKLELLRFKNQGDRKGQLLQWDRDGIALQPGNIMGFRLINLSREPVDVTLLFVDSSFGITPFFPANATVDNRLEPKGKPLLLRAQVTGDTVGLEKLVMIAAKAPGVKLPTDFSFLAQPSLERARGASGLRTRGEQVFNSPIGKLFQHALYNKGSSRGLVSADIDDHVLQVISWKVERGKK